MHHLGSKVLRRSAQRLHVGGIVGKDTRQAKVSHQHMHVGQVALDQKIFGLFKPGECQKINKRKSKLPHLEISMGNASIVKVLQGLCHLFKNNLGNESYAGIDQVVYLTLLLLLLVFFPVTPNC